jgi:hypothetical protein
LTRIRTALVALTTLAVVAAAATPAAAYHRAGPCDFHRRADETIRHFSKRRIVCAVERFGPVRGGTARAICIARRESGLYPTATSPTGEYRGLYQHDRDWWGWRFDTFTKRRWDLSKRALNGRTNAIVTIRMVSHFDSWREAGWLRREC